MKVYQCPTCHRIYSEIEVEHAKFSDCPECGVSIKMFIRRDAKEAVKRVEEDIIQRDEGFKRRVEDELWGKE